MDSRLAERVVVLLARLGVFSGQDGGFFGSWSFRRGDGGDAWRRRSSDMGGGGGCRDGEGRKRWEKMGREGERRKREERIKMILDFQIPNYSVSGFS